MAKLKLANSIYAKNLGNSVYQQKLAGAGLTVSGGTLINNRPDGMSGITQAAMLKKEMKYAEKKQCMADAVALGIQKAEAQEGFGIDMY